MRIFAMEGILNEDAEEGQDFDLDFGEDVTLVTESIYTACEQLDLMNRNLMVIESAKNSSPAVMREVLKVSQMHRASYARHAEVQEPVYHEVMATESMNDGSLVFALEEEAAAQQGIISKIIESIKKAFAWLMEKIKAIFGKSETPKQADDKAKEITMTLEEAIQKKDELPANSVLDVASLSKAFAGLGDSPDIPAVLNTLDFQKGGADTARDILKELEGVISKAKAGIDKAVGSSDDAMNAKTEFANTVFSTISSMAASNAQFKQSPFKDEHKAYGFASESDNVDLAASHFIGDFVTSRGPCGYAIVCIRTDNAAKFKADFKAKPDVKTTAKIKLPNKLSDLKALNDKIEETAKAVAAALEQIKGYKAEDKIRTFINDLNSLQGKVNGNKELGTVVMKMYSDYANGVGAIVRATVLLSSEVSGSMDIYRSVIKEAIRLSGAADEHKSEENKQADTPPKTEEEKPA